MRNWRILMLSAAVLTISGSAHASLVFDSTISQTGSGLGAVDTVLTIQATGQGMGGTETGSVAWNGSADVTTGDAKTGASQSLTRTIGSLGVTNASNLRVIFNADQPAGGPITLSNLVLSIFSATGQLLFDSGAFTPQSFASTHNGIGTNDAVFMLDASQAAAAQSAFGTASNRIGLSASANPARGGPETFALSSVSSPPTSVPEPASLALLTTALAGFAATRRRRSR